MSIKLIPNSERIYIEKAQIAKEIKLAKLEKMMDGNAGDDDEDDANVSISFDNDAGELDELEFLPTVSQYFECIFGLKDLYMYRAVILVYL